MEQQQENVPLKPHSAATYQMFVERPVYNLKTLQQTYHKVPNEVPLFTKAKKCMKDACTLDGLKHRLLLMLPFIMTLKTYKFREYLLPDIIAGLTVGIMHIPQGMGFALLTSLPPMYGIYSSFFPVLLYIFFGTAPHVSMGTMAVISIMVGVAVDREASLSGIPETSPIQTDLILNYTVGPVNATSVTTLLSPTENNLISFKVGIATVVTFLAGIIQMVMSVFHLGVITTFMSTSFICGFTSGAAVHIATSQIKFLLGITVQRYDGIFKLPMTWYSICSNIKQTNIAELIITIISLLILIVLKEIVNERFKSKLKFPIPADLIVVILGTVISYFAKLAPKFDVLVLGSISRGIPVPEVPPLQHAPNVIVEAVLVAIVGFVISYSMADMFSRKHGYEVDTNQELLANGLSNGISSFFHCFAGCAAPPRCAVVDAAGGKTTMSGIFAALLLLLVMLLIGPWFEALPNCVLGAIIIVALFPMFKQFKILPSYWKINRYDAATMLVTFLAVVILNIDIGLGLGIGFSILTVIIQAFFSNGFKLASAKETDLYLPSAKYSVEDVPNTRVFRFEGSLYFVSRETFKEQLFKATVNPRHIKDNKLFQNDEKILKTEIVEADTTKLSNNHPDHADQSNGTSSSLTSSIRPENLDIENIILDCSAMSYIDIMGINTIKQLHSDFRRVGITVVLANCSHSMQERLEAAGVLDSDINIYPTIHDAFLANTYCSQKQFPVGDSTVDQDLTAESNA